MPGGHRAQLRKTASSAARLFGAAEALREKIGIPMTVREREEYDRQVADLRAGMAKERFESAWKQGRSMSMDQAVRLATERTHELST